MADRGAQNARAGRALLSILAITGPIYIVIALGFLAGRSGLFSRADMRVLGKFVVNFALPALLFTALSQRHVADILNGRYLAAYALGSLAVLLVTTLLSFVTVSTILWAVSMLPDGRL